jgi:hypothetical protein
MPPPGVALDRLGFLTIGLFDGDNPGPGHQTTLEIIELGERLGFDSAWVRKPHEDYVQILSGMAGKLGPALGWRPAADREPGLPLVEVALPGGRDHRRTARYRAR